MSAKMPEKQFGHAGPKQEVFKMLPHHSESKDQDLFPSFSHAAAEIVSNSSDLEKKIILLAQCGKQRKYEIKVVESKAIVN